MKKVTLLDTLYLYGDKDISHEFYSNYVVTKKFKFLGISGGYHWYQHLLNEDKVGICEQTQADKMSSYPVVYQYSKKNCHSMTFDTYSNHISLYSCRIKRIDTCITFHDEDYIIYDTCISPFKSKVLFQGKDDEIETLYLGKRSTGKIVRHYNKSLELEATENFMGMAYYHSLFGTKKDLYTIEVELNRKHIMTKFGDVTYASIENLISYSLDTIALCVFFPDTDTNKQNYRNNNYKDIENKFSICEEELTYISSHHVVDKKVSFKSLVERTNRMIDNYVTNMKLPNEELDNFYMYYISALLDSTSHDTKLDDVEFQLSDKKISDTLKDELLQKVDLLRRNQDNSLEVEFSKYFINKV